MFCQEDKPLTYQHVWPAWLRKIFPHPPKSSTNFHQTLSNKPSPKEVSILAKNKIRQGYLLSVKYRKVCAHCNNVWLSGIEESVKPNVEKLILGMSVNLNGEEQRALALWITIVVIMAELTHPENMGIAKDIPNQIYQSNLPLPFARIYLGQYLGSDYSPFRYRHHAGVLMKPHALKQGVIPPTKPNCQTSAFVLGELLVVVDSADEEFYSDFAQTRIGYGSPLVEIHPTPSNLLTWPPSAPIGDAACDLICEGRFLSYYDTEKLTISTS